MTAPSTPPPGNPPPPGGYPPPPPPPAWVLPTQAYTRWIARLGAFIVDIIPAAVVFGIGGVIGQIAGDCSEIRTDARRVGYCGWADTANGGTLLGLAFMLALVSYALTLAYLIWNFGYRQGKTGSSIGKSVLKFKVVSERTWQPIGFWLSIVRQVVHWVDQLVCYIGFLWPLWDNKRQTFADKIMGTVCVPSNPQPAGSGLQPVVDERWRP
jgi:uncharacterized RDD family membrane protein YckC